MLTPSFSSLSYVWLTTSSKYAVSHDVLRENASSVGTVGDAVGEADGVAVGAFVGDAVGDLDGAKDGANVGETEGAVGEELVHT